MRIQTTNDSYDKVAFAAAKGGSGAAYGSITNLFGVCGIPDFGFGQIEDWRTHDGGDSWQGPTIDSPDITFITDPKNPNCGLTGTYQQGSVPPIGPKGEVYVTWLEGPTFTGPKGSIESTNASIEVARSGKGPKRPGHRLPNTGLSSAQGPSQIGRRDNLDR